MLASNAFEYFVPGKNSIENNIIYINSYNDKYLLGTPSGFHLFDPGSGKSISYTDLTGQIGKAEISAYYLDKEKNLWIGTSGNGLYLRNSSGQVTLFHRSDDSGSDDIKGIEIENRNIWLSTTNGIVVIDKRSGDIRSEKKRFDISNGLPHNSITSILLAHDGNAYIGTESDRLYKIDADFNISEGSSVMNGSTRNKIVAFSQNSDSIVWAATNGNGIFEFINDSIIAINKSNDLLSNYCYSILADSEKNIWIGHEKGFSKFNTINGTMTVLWY